MRKTEPSDRVHDTLDERLDALPRAVDAAIDARAHLTRSERCGQAHVVVASEVCTHIGADAVAPLPRIARAACGEQGDLVARLHLSLIHI